MTYNEIVRTVADNMGSSTTFVDKVYKSYWKSVREHVKSMPLMEDLSEEEFLKLKPNVNIPSLGKLNVTLSRYMGVKKHLETRRQILENNKKSKGNVEN